MKFMKLAILLLTGIVSISAKPTGSGGAAVQFDALRKMLDSGQSFTCSEKSINSALHVIVDLASKYVGFNEEQLLGLSGLGGKKADSEYMHTYSFSDPSTDATTEIDYDPRRGKITRVRLERADNDYVDVRLNLLSPSEISSGRVSLANGGVHVSFKRGMPWLAIPFVGRPPVAHSSGVLRGWSYSGELIIEHQISTPTHDMGAIQEMIASLLPSQQDAMDFPISMLMEASPGYRTGNEPLKRFLEDIASVSGYLLQLSPEHLTNYYGRAVTIESHSEVNGMRRYRLKDDQGDFTSVVFESSTDHLSEVQVEQGSNLQRYLFDYKKRSRLIAVYYRRDSPEPHGMLSLYPDREWPRIAIYREVVPQEDVDDKRRKVMVWSPQGDTLMDRNVVPQSKLSAVLEEIQSALTDEQKNQIGWLGVDEEEARILLGAEK